jgi:hypothetical protein
VVSFLHLKSGCFINRLTVKTWIASLI